MTFSILENNLDKIHWYSLSRNTNAISILEKNLDKVDWNPLCYNINSISVLEKNLDKVSWYYLIDYTNLFYPDFSLK